MHPLVEVSTTLMKPKALSTPSKHAEGKLVPKGDCMELPETSPVIQPLVELSTSSLTQPKALSATSRHDTDYKPLPKEQGDCMELPDTSPVEEEPTQPLVKVPTSSLTQPKALSATSRHAPDYKPLPKEQGDCMELPDTSPVEEEPTQPLVKVPTSSLTQPKALSATSRHAPDYKPLPKEQGDCMELPDTSPVEEEPTQPLVKVPTSSLTQPKALSATSRHAPDYKPLPKEQDDCMELPDTSPVDIESVQPLVEVPTTPTEPEEGDLIFTLDFTNVPEDDMEKVDNCFNDDSGDEFVLDSHDDSDSDSSSETFPGIKESLKEFDFDFDDEFDVFPEVKNPQLFITKVIKSFTAKNGKTKKDPRVFNSYQYCLPFSKKVSNFSQHICRQHKNEPAVKEICMMEKGKEKKTAIGMLRNKYNHHHNLKSIEKGKGEIILHRRPTHEFVLSEYGPCPDCLQWIQQKLLKRHQKSCFRSDMCESPQGSLKTKSDALAGRIHTQASEKLTKEVFAIMRSDGFGKVSQEDPLIIALGNQLMDKNIGNELKRGKYTSQIMRLCAKLLVELRKIKPLDNNSMADYLTPGNFNEIVEAVLKISSLNKQEEKQTPSNAIKIGYDLKRLINLKLVFCGIMQKDEQARKDSEDLMQMMKVLWGTKVTKTARVLLDTRKFQKSVPLPSAEDITRLHDHLQEELKEVDLSEEIYDNFIRVAELTISKIVTYNRRRTGEVEAVKVRDYCKRSRGAVNDITELTHFERRLLETQDVMEVRGKTGRGVPIILPPEIQKTMDFLSSSVVRQKCGIKSPYLFARKGDGTVRAYDALHKTATSAGIEEPSKVTSTQLRKYMATITQVLDLKENQLNWVLNHMGHTLDVHKIHYRATSDVIERTQIAKILLIQDHSRMKEFANRKLDDIQMDELFLEAKERSEQDITGGELEELLDKAEKFFDEDVAEEDEAKKARSHLTRKAWSKEEEEEIQAEFRENFDRLCRPKVKAVERCLRKSKKRGGTLHLRTKETLKKKIFRMIDAELRKAAD